MKLTQVLTLSVLTLAAGTALAADANAPLTRAQVRESVLEARAAGQLLPAGEAADFPSMVSAKSDVTRSEVRSEVIEARKNGNLIPAGEGEEEAVDRTVASTPSLVSRAEVKKETLEARDEGELIPAGAVQGQDLAREIAQDRYARQALIARKASKVAAGN